MASDGMGGLIGKLGEAQKSMNAMMLFADVLNKTQKRIKAIIKSEGTQDKDKLAEALAKDRIDWMMTDMATVAEMLEGFEAEEADDAN